jgi:DNA-directed RNA polymerase specialized sigma24 family protein
MPSHDHAPDQHLDLTEAVAALPIKQRQAVAYHYLAGLPYAQIAALLDSTASATRRAAADGIAALRRSHAHNRIEEKGDHQ